MAALVPQHRCRFPQDPDEKELVRGELNKILASRHFRNSKKFSAFIRYVVEKTIDGSPADLKERLLGVELFERAADYDTSADPTVRIAAGEVRKRLAQYYQEIHDADVIQIRLPVGGYQAQFLFPPIPQGLDPALDSVAGQPDKVASSADAPARLAAEFLPVPSLYRKVSRLRIVLALSVLAIGALVWHGLPRADEKIRAFWEPAVHDNRTLLILCGDYSFPQQVDPPAVELMQYPSVYTVSNIESLLSDRGLNFTVKPLSRITYRDLQTSPSVVVATPDNTWVPLRMRGARFQFGRTSDGVTAILDSKHPDFAGWSAGPKSVQTSTDYAVIYRTHDLSTGHWSYVISGLTERGVFAAARLATNPSTFRAEVQMSSYDLRTKPDLEFVVSTQVVNGISGVAQVVAVN